MSKLENIYQIRDKHDLEGERVDEWFVKMIRELEVIYSAVNDLYGRVKKLEGLSETFKGA